MFLRTGYCSANLLTSDWVLWIDADEHLHPDDIQAVKEAAALYDGMDPVAVLYIWQLNEYIKEDSANPGWWTYYARESLATGLTEQALQGLAEAESTAQSAPNFARLLDVYMMTAKIRIQQQQWKLAEEACLKALDRNPDFPDAQFYLAVVKMRQASQLYQEAEQL